MATISAKFGDEEDRKLREICEFLRIDKSEALRRATEQLWLGLQIGKTFEERAGGPPKVLLRSGNPEFSSRDNRKAHIASHLDGRSRKRQPKQQSVDE